VTPARGQVGVRYVDPDGREHIWTSTVGSAYGIARWLPEPRGGTSPGAAAVVCWDGNGWVERPKPPEQLDDDGRPLDEDEAMKRWYAALYREDEGYERETVDPHGDGHRGPAGDGGVRT
jgi:hypothetical protein